MVIHDFFEFIFLDQSPLSQNSDSGKPSERRDERA